MSTSTLHESIIDAVELLRNPHLHNYAVTIVFRSQQQAYDIIPTQEDLTHPEFVMVLKGDLSKEHRKR